MAFVVDTSSAKEFALAHWLVGGADAGRLFGLPEATPTVLNGKVHFAGSYLCLNQPGISRDRFARAWEAYASASAGLR